MELAEIGWGLTSHPDGGSVDVSAPLDREFQKALDLFGWQVDAV